MAETKKTVFDILSAIDCNEHVETKGPQKLSYLSWAWAWSILKKNFPDATYKVYENEHGMFYHTDGRTGWVKTGVTVNGVEYIDYLPIMDFSNRSISVEKITSYDVNKAIQRSLTKAIARHGLGLYIYAGEDLPEDVVEESKINIEQQFKAVKSIIEQQAKSAKTTKELNSIWTNNPALQRSLEFKQILSQRKQELANG